MNKYEAIIGIEAIITTIIILKTNHANDIIGYLIAAVFFAMMIITLLIEQATK